jgi:23S rRNA (uracil1939-C5)-methyltransferase
VPGALAGTAVSHAAPNCRPEADTVCLDVTALSHGPDGVARHQGSVVFVPGVAPGDHVHARLVQTHRRFARAEVVRRIPGPAHRTPPCPWVEACGGCPWQQVAYEAQLAAKAANVRETLARVGGVTPRRELPIIAAPAEWRYRRRIRLHVDRRGALGYRAPRSHRIVEIDDCVIADDALSAALPLARRLVRALRTRLATLELVANGRGAVVLHGVAEGPFADGDPDVLAEVVATSATLAGVALEGRDWRRDAGDVQVLVRPDEQTSITQRPGAFSQVNDDANRALVATVRSFARPAARVLDLFCGSGNLSLPLATDGLEVLGVDADTDAIDAARAVASTRAGDCRFEAVPALRFLRTQGLAGADLVVLDPPRTGAADEVVQLARLRPPRVLYVSCDPATLARDAKTLAAAGYVIGRVQALDLFPQTPHVEIVLEALVAID